jgi:hypothetical protein
MVGFLTRGSMQKSFPALKKLLLAACACAAAGCASLQPEAHDVRLTRESKEVSGCREVGSVQSWISFSFNDAQTQLKNKASHLGGDTVLVTSTFGEDLGTAYDCRPQPPKK